MRAVRDGTCSISPLSSDERPISRFLDAPAGTFTVHPENRPGDFCTITPGGILDLLLAIHEGSLSLERWCAEARGAVS